MRRRRKKKKKIRKKRIATSPSGEILVRKQMQEAREPRCINLPLQLFLFSSLLGCVKVAQNVLQFTRNDKETITFSLIFLLQMCNTRVVETISIFIFFIFLWKWIDSSVINPRIVDRAARLRKQVCCTRLLTNYVHFDWLCENLSLGHWVRREKSSNHTESTDPASLTFYHNYWHSLDLIDRDIFIKFFWCTYTQFLLSFYRFKNLEKICNIHIIRKL